MNTYYGLVYKVTNTVNGKIYIGITTQDFEKYKKKHIRVAYTNKQSKQKVFYRAIRKYGSISFTWEVLKYCVDKNDLCSSETFYITEFRTFMGFDDCNGYNMTLGGEHYGYKLANHPNEKEIRNKLSLLRKGKTHEEIYGLEGAKKLKKSVSDKLKNRVISEKTKNKTKILNKKCFMIFNIYTSECKFLYNRVDVETICEDTFYRVQKFKTDWALLKVVRFRDIDDLNDMLQLSVESIQVMYNEYISKNPICAKKRKKRTTSNITKGKTYEEIYGEDETKKRKETWNGRRK